MNAYGAYGGGLPQGAALPLEATVAVIVALVVLITSFASLRERYRDVAAWHVHLGALIYGAVLGLVIGFIIVPLRFLLSSSNVPPQTAAWSGLGFLGVMFALRRGLIGRLPFLGPQVRAYRRASLRRSIELSQKQLERLMSKTAAPEGGAGAEVKVRQ